MKLSTSSLSSSAIWSVMPIMTRWCDVIAYSGEVDAGSPTRTCANEGIESASTGTGHALAAHAFATPVPPPVEAMRPKTGISRKFLTPWIRARSLSGPTGRRSLPDHQCYRIVILGGFHEAQARHCRHPARRRAGLRPGARRTAAASGAAAAAGGAAATAAAPRTDGAAGAAAADGAEADRGAGAEGRGGHRCQQAEDGCLLQARQAAAADGRARREEGHEEAAGARPA